MTLKITPESIIKSNKKSKIEIIWNENHEVFYDAVQFWIGPIPTGTNMKTTIKSNNNKIKLAMLQAIYHEKVLEYSFNSLFPVMKRKLENSETIKFGPISLDNVNFTIKNKKYRLDQLKGLILKDGFCIFNIDGKIFNTKIRIKEIPNFNCMYKLIIKD